MKIEHKEKYDPRHRNARVFIEPYKKETTVEQLFARRERPYIVWRKTVIPHVLRDLGLPSDTRVRWSQYAGCTCPCSPAFIIEGTDGYKNVYVQLEKGDVQ